MKALSPKGEGWIRKGFQTNPRIPKSARGWEHLPTGALVLSSAEPSGVDGGMEYHLSVSKYVGRSSTDECMFALRAFGMDNAQEDNAAGLDGEIRHFWQAVKKGAA